MPRRYTFLVKGSCKVLSTSSGRMKMVMSVAMFTVV